MQQATVNLFADMGAQPATLQSGLIATTSRPTPRRRRATVTSPAAGAALTDGATMTISGTATDAGGGVVAAVEVSTDGGTTWHPASGTTSWTYSWIAHGSPVGDDQGPGGRRLGQHRRRRAPARPSPSPAPARSSAGPTPATADSGDDGSVEVGVKFRSDVAGTINGIRFYKATANTGTHVGSLWTAAGTLLAQATFSGESASGWQQVTFSSPVAIQPNTTYVAAYFAPNGHYSATRVRAQPPARRRRRHPRQPAAARRCPTTATATASTSTRRQHVPDQSTYQARTTGST